MNLDRSVEKALEKALHERGHANILVLGHPGAGGKTLIDRTFQGQVATTGEHRPVMPGCHSMEKEGVPLTVYDARGLMERDPAEARDSMKGLLEERAAKPDPRDRLHVAWVIVPEDRGPVEDRQAEMVAMLAERMPVVVVIPRSRHDGEFESEVKSRMPKAAGVMRVRALPERLDDGHELEVMGLPELIEKTEGLMPEDQRPAFTAAQKVCMDMKVRRSHVIVAAAAASSAGIAATPVPVADVALLVPILIGMLAGITTVFGFQIGQGFLRTVVSSTVGGTAAAFSLRAVLGEALKLMPGHGTLAGGAIAATTAATICTTFGEAYIAVLERLVREKGGEAPTADEVVTHMHRALGR
jgi:uncharacterized protein (DUF697 family)